MLSSDKTNPEAVLMIVFLIPETFRLETNTTHTHTHIYVKKISFFFVSPKREKSKYLKMNRSTKRFFKSFILLLHVFLASNYNR